MHRIILVACLLAGLGSAARADDLIAVASPRPVKETLDRLQEVVRAADFSVVARVPHSAAAEGVGLTLRPTELLVFGNPRGGTPVMQCNQRAGIDLPLRALAWQDEAGKVWLAMHDPKTLATDWNLGAACEPVIERMTAAVRKMLGDATAP